MERRAARVSESHWEILLDYLERNPNLARARGYNNTARGRAESSRQWSEVAELLNAEGSGTNKCPKDWIYVSNYKSKFKKKIAGINADAHTTGGGPPSGEHLSNTKLRFLSLMGQRFVQPTHEVAVDPLPEGAVDMAQISTLAGMHQQMPGLGAEEEQEAVVIATRDVLNTESGSSVGVEPLTEITAPSMSAPTSTPADDITVPLLRRTRQTRYRSRPLAPLDEARRILSQVELQRSAADMAAARASQQIADNLGRLADAVERYLSHMGIP